MDVATLRPSVALSTEIAGVMMPSPNKSAEPMMTRKASKPTLPAGFGFFSLGTSASRAMMPPSPWLSARITNIRYFTEMMMIRAQKASDATPMAYTAFDASR